LRPFVTRIVRLALYILEGLKPPQVFEKLQRLDLRFVVTATGPVGAIISNTHYSARAADWPTRTVGRPVLTAIGQRNPIGTIRRYANGTRVTLSGRATIYTGGFDVGEGREKFYVQDDSGGVQVYAWSTALPDVTIGDQVTATGELRTYYGETELVIFFPSRVSVSDGDPSQAPEALDLSLDEVGESTEGQLVRVQGQVSWIEESTYGWFIELTDEQANALIYVYKSTGIDVSGCQVGEAYSITGINTQYEDNYFIRPRLQADVISLASSSTAGLAPKSGRLGTPLALPDVRPRLHGLRVTDDRLSRR